MVNLLAKQTEPGVTTQVMRSNWTNFTATVDRPPGVLSFRPAHRAGTRAPGKVRSAFGSRLAGRSISFPGILQARLIPRQRRQRITPSLIGTRMLMRCPNGVLWRLIDVRGYARRSYLVERNAIVMIIGCLADSIMPAIRCLRSSIKSFGVPRWHLTPEYKSQYPRG